MKLGCVCMNELWAFLELDKRNEYNDHKSLKSKMLAKKSARITATQKELDKRFDQMQRDFLMSLTNESEFFTDDFVTDSPAKIFCKILQRKD